MHIPRSPSLPRVCQLLSEVYNWLFEDSSSSYVHATRKQEGQEVWTLQYDAGGIVGILETEVSFCQSPGVATFQSRETYTFRDEHF